MMILGIRGGVHEGVGERVDEGFFVTDDVGVVDGGQDTHLVEGVLALFLVEVDEFDFFHGVGEVVGQAEHLVDRGVGALAQFGLDLEFFERHGGVLLLDYRMGKRIWDGRGK